MGGCRERRGVAGADGVLSCLLFAGLGLCSCLSGSPLPLPCLSAPLLTTTPPTHDTHAHTQHDNLPQASPFGVNVGAGAQFALDRTASVDSVFVTAMASKVQYPPVKLPTLIPPMTPESLSLLSSRGRAAFYATYGTHFVFGFRLGGYLSYMFQYQSSE